MRSVKYPSPAHLEHCFVIEALVDLKEALLFSYDPIGEIQVGWREVFTTAFAAYKRAFPHEIRWTGQ